MKGSLGDVIRIPAFVHRFRSRSLDDGLRRISEMAREKASKEGVIMQTEIAGSDSSLLRTVFGEARVSSAIERLKAQISNLEGLIDVSILEMIQDRPDFRTLAIQGCVSRLKRELSAEYGLDELVHQLEILQSL